jgi:hypothetical protein
MTPDDVPDDVPDCTRLRLQECRDEQLMKSDCVPDDVPDYARAAAGVP